MIINLSPYEKDRMVPTSLGQTDMGRDLLAQDYLLKQLTASLIYPQNSLGKSFWATVYSKAQKEFGTTNIPVNTFNKVWIVPQRIGIYEHGQAVFIVDSHLKVMLEEDYLATTKHMAISESATVLRNNTNQLGSQIIRQIVLPQIEKEVNEGKNFATLRQIVYAQALAVWFKHNLRQALLNQVYANKSTVKGIDQNTAATNEAIYQQYLRAYKKGVFNYIKEDIDPITQETLPRKYFSGGFDGQKVFSALVPATFSPGVEGKLTASGPTKFVDVSDLFVINDNKAAATLEKNVGAELIKAGREDVNNPDAAMTIYNQVDDALQKIPSSSKEDWQVDWRDFLFLTAPDGTSVNVAVSKLLSGRFSDGRYAIFNNEVGDRTFYGYLTPDGNMLPEHEYNRPLLELAVKALVELTPEIAARNKANLQAKEAARLQELQKVTFRKEKGDVSVYQKRKEELEALQLQNEALQGIPKDQFSLQLFLKIVNTLEVSFPRGSLDPRMPKIYHSLEDMNGLNGRTRYGATGIQHLFLRNGHQVNPSIRVEQETIFLNVPEYQKLGGNPVEFIENVCTLHLVDDPKDNTRVRIILRPRHPGEPLPNKPGYFETYQNLVKEGVPVLWDDPKRVENQFSKVYSGEYNYKWDRVPSTNESGPLFADAAMTALRNKDGEDYRTVIGRLEPYLKKLSVTILTKSGKKTVNVFDYLQDISNGSALSNITDEVRMEFNRLDLLSNEELVQDKRVQELLVSLGDLKGDLSLENLLSRFSEPYGAGLQHHLGTSAGEEIVLREMLSRTNSHPEKRERAESLLKRAYLYTALVFILLHRWGRDAAMKAYKGKDYEITAQGLLIGKIFSIEFLERERAIAAKHPTIAIDLYPLEGLADEVVKRIKDADNAMTSEQIKANLKNNPTALFNVNFGRSHTRVFTKSLTKTIDYGGIDLSEADAAMRVTKDANGGIVVNVDPALIARVERQGISEAIPVIINMKPADLQSAFQS